MVPDQPSGNHVISRPVDSFDAQQSSLPETKGRAAGARYITPDDDIIATRRQAGDLQLEIPLITPEPRNARIASRLANETCRDAPRLIRRVLYRLDSYGGTFGKEIRMSRAISDSTDVRVRRA